MTERHEREQLIEVETRPCDGHRDRAEYALNGLGSVWSRRARKI